MGLLTTLVIAPPDDAPAVCSASRHADRWPCVDLKRLDNAKLAALASAWNDPAQAEALESDAYIVADAGANGPWVFQLPDAFRDRLAAVTTVEFPALAACWASQDELKFDGWTAPDVTTLLELLQPFAARATAADQPLLLWMAL